MEFEKIENAIKNKVNEYYEDGINEIQKQLDSYTNIIQSAKVSFTRNEGININIKLHSDIKHENQDIIQVLCKGGAIKKGEEYLKINSNTVLYKYLGKR